MRASKMMSVLGGFRDPRRRPRYLVWSAVAMLVLASFVIVALGATSTRWFCVEGCHKVQDDTIQAYRRSTHAEVSCMACHMPPSANPIVFVLHKAEALRELYFTVTDQYELPLNGESEVALTMKSGQCTQCHNLGNRRVTPAAGIIIDHEAHADKDVTCGICHNRIAHVEDFKLALFDPASGEPNRVHEDFMSMTACFRCHTQSAESPGLKAPGTCSACHSADFDLKPASHKRDGFYPAGHAELAQEEASRAAAVSDEAEAGADGEPTESPQAEPAQGEAHGEEGIGMSLPKVESLSECATCHSPKFCTDCHGLPMPHPAGFKKGHGKLGKTKPKACVRCHGSAATFCDECHHGKELEYDILPSPVWMRQHPQAVRKLGTSRCFDCHEPTYCSHCHVNGPDSVR